jgi:hypothetical protein
MGWTFLQWSGRLQYWPFSAIFKKYLQCVLAARIFTVEFVVCTLAAKKKIRAGFDMSDRTIPLRVSQRSGHAQDTSVGT